MRQVQVVLVNWNGWRDTLECLESLLLLDYPDFGVVVCDNGSTDQSLARIAGWASQKGLGCDVYRRTEAETGGTSAAPAWLTLVDVGENLGFAGGNNVGLRYALARGVEFCWLLNNDTVVEPEALTQLVARMRQGPKVGICGSSIRSHHDPDRIQALGGGHYYRWLGLPWHYGRFTRWSNSGVLHRRAESLMNYVEGASMLVSREFLVQVGLMDEEYFLFMEEADWALRARGRFTLGYAPGSIVYHKVGRSIGTSSHPGRKSFICDFYNVRNRILFARRYHPATLPTIYLVLLGELLLRLLCGKWDRFGMILALMLRGGKSREPRP